MRSALLSVGTVLVLGGVALLVHFLGIPVRGEPLQQGVRYRPIDAVGRGAIRGQVLDRRGRGLEGIRVAATGDGPVSSIRRAQLEGPEQTLHETRTDPDGSFLLIGMEPERVRLWAGGGPWLYRMTHPVEVRAGQVCSGVSLHLEPRPQNLAD